MTARNAISTLSTGSPASHRKVDSSTPLLEVLPLLLDTPGRELAVFSGEEYIGMITETSLLEALGSLIATRDDSSVLTMECDPRDYSASAIARAVEDVDAHLVDLLSRPSGDGLLSVTIRVRTLEPEHVARSLERYGYRVTEAGAHPSPAIDVLSERLAALQLYLNV